MARGVGASVRGDARRTQSRLNPAVHAELPLPVVSPNAKGSAFRVEVTGFNNYRLHKRSNRVLFVPFDQLLKGQQQVQRQGGRIASLTPVN